MATLSLPGSPKTRSRRSGAIVSGVPYILSVRDDPELSCMSPADTVTIQSPRKADATHATLTYRVNGSDLRVGILLGGGGTVTEDGPVYSVEVIPDATVAGLGADTVLLTFSGVDKVG